MLFGQPCETRVKLSRTGITSVNRTYFLGNISTAMVNGTYRFDWVFETKKLKRWRRSINGHHLMRINFRLHRMVNRD
ncbi:hypothetical protein ES703_58260 [subsurface metagenome]